MSKIEVDSTNERYIILIDMDCYYAQVEMKRHKIDPNKPVIVQQWNTLIAMNYVAKAKGVKRGMTVYEALCVCPDVITVHVSTIEVKEKADQGPRKMQRFWCDIDPQKDKG
jgi:nucleotidyltransferase/DNA polymerase involved in DNA repair